MKNLYTLTFVIAFGALHACQEKRHSSAQAKDVRVPAVMEQRPVLLSSNVKGGVSEKLVRDQGGDQLPVVVDPESPGSCALVAKGERCGYCCSDVFVEESERWYQCMNTCAKHENAALEH